MNCGTNNGLVLASVFKDVLRILTVMLLFKVPGVYAHGDHGYNGLTQSQGVYKDNPRGLITSVWQHPQFRNVVTAGYPDSFGLFAFNGRQSPRKMLIEGKLCIQSHFLGFDIDDDLAYDTDVDLRVRLQVAKQLSGSLLMGYDRHGKIDAFQILEADPSVTGTKTGLHWIEVTLPKARLINRGMAGTDLALTTLETMKLPQDIKKEDITTFVLCDMQLSGFSSEAKKQDRAIQTHKVTLNFLVDEQTTPVRFGIYDQNGSQMVVQTGVLSVPFYEGQRRILSLRDALNPEQFWPHENRYYQYTDGQIEMALPAGEYLVVASKGPEFQITQQTFVVADKSTVNNPVLNQQVTLKRIANWPERGWFSGDVHVHMNRQKADDNNLLAIAQAEDLQVTNLLAMSNITKAHYPQPAYGDTGQSILEQNGMSSAYYALIPGVEAPRTAFRGHAVSLNIDAMRPVDNDYYLYHKYFSHYQQQGAVNGYAHIGSEEFNGSWGLALDTPFGLVDFVEIMQNSKMRTELWYEHLNIGQRIAPAAGSDFPYFDQPGAVRVYVKQTPGSAGDADSWFEGLKAGRAFISNGPLIEFKVDGLIPGDSLAGESLTTKDQYTLNLEVLLDPLVDKLKQVELLHCGEVIEQFQPSSAGAFKTQKSFSVPSSGWLAVRVKGQYSALAHTGAIYLPDANGNSICPDKYVATLNKMLWRMEQLAESLPMESKELEFWESQTLLAQFYKQRDALKQRISLALQHYLSLFNIGSENDD